MFNSKDKVIIKKTKLAGEVVFIDKARSGDREREVYHVLLKNGETRHYTEEELTTDGK